MKKYNFLITVVILCITALIAVPFYYFVPKEKNIAQVSNLPLQIGEWKGEELEVDELVYKILETKNLIVREYESADGEKVYLYIVYSQENRKVSHPPEVCFEGGGMTVEDKIAVPLEIAKDRIIKVNQFKVEQKNYRNLVIYWYKAGSLYTASYLRQQLKIALNMLRLKNTSGALIRVSTGLSDNNEADFERMERFCQALYPLLDKTIP